MGRWTTTNDNPGLAKDNGTTCPEYGSGTGNCASVYGVTWPTGSVGGVAYEVRWTAPYTTTIWVTGDVWMMRNQSVASTQQQLDILIGSTDLGVSLIPKSSRASTSYSFSTAYGSAALTAISITAGQSINFIVRPSATAEDFVGMDITITALDQPADAPEPATLGFMGSGLIAMGLLLRRKKA